MHIQECITQYTCMTTTRKENEQTIKSFSIQDIKHDQGEYHMFCACIVSFLQRYSDVLVDISIFVNRTDDTTGILKKKE